VTRCCVPPPSLLPPVRLYLRAYLLLATYYCKDTGELQEAQQYCSRLLDIGGQVKG
jgi:hypothetical protein